MWHLKVNTVGSNLGLESAPDWIVSMKPSVEPCGELTKFTFYKLDDTEPVCIWIRSALIASITLVEEK